MVPQNGAEVFGTTKAAAAPGQILEQHRRAGPSAHQARPSAHQAPGPTGSRVRQSANRATNAGRLRGDGDDQKGTGSEHWRVRYARSGRLCRGPVRGRDKGGLIWTLSRFSQPAANVATDPCLVPILL